MGTSTAKLTLDLASAHDVVLELEDGSGRSFRTVVWVAVDGRDLVTSIPAKSSFAARLRRVSEVSVWRHEKGLHRRQRPTTGVLRCAATCDAGRPGAMHHALIEAYGREVDVLRFIGKVNGKEPTAYRTFHLSPIIRGPGHLPSDISGRI